MHVQAWWALTVFACVPMKCLHGYSVAAAVWSHATTRFAIKQVAVFIYPFVTYKAISLFLFRWFHAASVPRQGICGQYNSDVLKFAAYIMYSPDCLSQAYSQSDWYVCYKLCLSKPFWWPTISTIFPFLCITTFFVDQNTALFFDGERVYYCFWKSSSGRVQDLLKGCRCFIFMVCCLNCFIWPLGRGVYIMGLYIVRNSYLAHVALCIIQQWHSIRLNTVLYVECML